MDAPPPEAVDARFMREAGRRMAEAWEDRAAWMRAKGRDGEADQLEEDARKIRQHYGVE